MVKLVVNLCDKAKCLYFFDLSNFRSGQFCQFSLAFGHFWGFLDIFWDFYHNSLSSIFIMLVVVIRSYVIKQSASTFLIWTFFVNFHRFFDTLGDFWTFLGTFIIIGWAPPSPSCCSWPSFWFLWGQGDPRASPQQSAWPCRPHWT